MKVQSLEDKTNVEISEIGPDTDDAQASCLATQQGQHQPASAPSATDVSSLASQNHSSPGTSAQSAEQQNKWQEEQQLEDSLNAVMKERTGRFRLHLVCGDFAKQLSGRRALKGAFDVATVGVMHAHLLRGQHKLGEVLAPGAVVLVEGAQNLVQVGNSALLICVIQFLHMMLTHHACSTCIY